MRNEKLAKQHVLAETMLESSEKIAIKLVVIKDYESAFDAVTLIQIP